MKDIGTYRDDRVLMSHPQRPARTAKLLETTDDLSVVRMFLLVWSGSDRVVPQEKRKKWNRGNADEERWAPSLMPEKKPPSSSSSSTDNGTRKSRAKPSRMSGKATAV